MKNRIIGRPGDRVIGRLLTPVKTRLRAWWERITGIQELKEAVERWKIYHAEATLANCKFKVLLDTAAVRRAPEEMREILASSNGITGNVCYLHPEALAKVWQEEPEEPGDREIGSSGDRKTEDVENDRFRAGFDGYVGQEEAVSSSS